jgi:hypothetical protein
MCYLHFDKRLDLYLHKGAGLQRCTGADSDLGLLSFSVPILPGKGVARAALKIPR